MSMSDVFAPNGKGGKEDQNPGPSSCPENSGGPHRFAISTPDGTRFVRGFCRYCLEMRIYWAGGPDYDGDWRTRNEEAKVLKESSFRIA